MVKTTTCQAHFVAGQRFRTSLASQEPISGVSLGSPARPTHLGFLLDGIVGFSQRCDG